MKIFILNPSIYSKKKSIMNVRPRQPLSLAYIAALLLKNKHEIKFLDANVLKYDVNKTTKEIKKYNPDILILTSSPVDRWECPNSYIDSVFEIINKANIHPAILTGSHGSLTPEWVFEKCNVDYIVRGEPEMIALELVEAIKNKKDIKNIKGISYKSGNRVINNEEVPRIENLDNLPLPAYHLLPMEKYKYGFSDLPQPFTIMLTSRGCPFKCIFCLKAMSKDKYIVRSPKDVVEEIEHLVKNFNIKSIFFQDWEFTIDKKRVKEICDLILEKAIKLIWGCNARATDLNEELVKKMKKAGCVRINIGFESGSQRILDKANKRIKVQDLEKAIKICRESGINIGMYAMVNLPGENLKTIRESVKFLKRNKIESMTPNFPIPYFGTEIFKQLRNKYRNKEFNWDNIENYAGRVETRISPKIARFYYRLLNFIRKKT